MSAPNTLPGPTACNGFPSHRVTKRGFSNVDVPGTPFTQDVIAEGDGRRRVVGVVRHHAGQRSRRLRDTARLVLTVVEDAGDDLALLHHFDDSATNTAL